MQNVIRKSTTEFLFSATAPGVFLLILDFELTFTIENKNIYGLHCFCSEVFFFASLFVVMPVYNAFHYCIIYHILTIIK